MPKRAGRDKGEIPHSGRKANGLGRRNARQARARQGYRKRKGIEGKLLIRGIIVFFRSPVSFLVERYPQDVLDFKKIRADIKTYVMENLGDSIRKDGFYRIAIS